MEDVIRNKVAESGIITINLEEFYPKEIIEFFDLKDFLFMGLILKEKDFRQALQTIEWEKFSDKIIAVGCSADAIIPVWAYMLVTAYLQPFAKDVFFGNATAATEYFIVKNLSEFNPENFTDKRIVIKGCGDVKIPDAAYLEITKKLRPFAKSIMYGEPCSTVPVYKNKI